ncbi:MAG: hypothetical protein JO288_08620 [Hyphomicrobiales bacterium]|nr:hypothetical protein [Hyphomicrobiales bacterium]
MSASTGPKRSVRARRRNGGGEDERERALLAEFLRHRDVASLAGAIARRLGGGVRETDLIAGAGLEPRPERGEDLRSADSELRFDRSPPDWRLPTNATPAPRNGRKPGPSLDGPSSDELPSGRPMAEEG